MPLGAARALVRRTFRDARIRTFAFAYLFAIYAYIQPVGYRHAYPTLADRLGFAHSFAANEALRLFYGYPYNPLTVGGYSAWRVGGTLAILAAVFGLLAAVRALRGEEDTGRMELVLAGGVGRRTTYLSAMAAIGVGILILWLAEFAGFIAGGLSARRVGLPRPGDSVGDTGVRGRRRAREPARTDAAHGARAGQRGRRPVPAAARDRRHLARRRRGCAGRRRSAGPRSCGRSPAPARWFCCYRSP